MRVRVVVADDNLITRAGIVQLLSPEFDVVAACGDLPEVLDAVDREGPDVVLTDIRMPPSHSDEGIRVANRLRETHPEIGVIVLSQYDEPLYALTLLESGSDRRGYLLKERVHDSAALRDAVHTVVRGGAVIDPLLVDALVKGKAAIERSALADLSPRERQVLAEIAQGKSNAAIADSLVLSKRAVEKHINAIFLKLGLAFADDVSKRVKATLMFLSESELAPPATITDG
jgi:DNA-binding NarL/FixJ family response regulator